MKANIGSTDKLVRLALAIAIIILFYKGTITDTLGTIGLIVALLLTVTSLISFCPLYPLFKINTARKDIKKDEPKS